MNKNCPCYYDCLDHKVIVCPCDQQKRAESNSVAAAFLKAVSTKAAK